MTESRQQRRARERAERKAATRPGPNLHAVPDLPSLESESVSIEVGVEWMEDRERPEDSFWSAEWGERESEVVISENAETFSEMIEMVLTDLAERWGGSGLEIEWTLDRAAKRECDRSAIELPERMSVPG